MTGENRSCATEIGLECRNEAFGWSEGNEVYLPLIDAEHRGLFGLADGLQNAVSAGAAATEVRGNTCTAWPPKRKNTSRMRSG